MPVLLIDGNTFTIRRDFNTDGSSVLAQTFNFWLDLVIEEDKEETEDKEE